MLQRISRHQLFMGIAELASMRSTCFRRAVGAVIVQANNVISIGYNGAPKDQPHCTGKTCPTEGVCTRAVHAEKNAYDRLHYEAGTEPFIMYVTESPCLACARYIAEIIEKVYYMHPYRLQDGVDHLIKEGVLVYRMTPSGYIIDHVTGELVYE